jgi:hypothetical protein
MDDDMEPLLWVLLPGFVAVASGLLAWFVMQSRMDVKLAQQEIDLAQQREILAEERGKLTAQRQALESQLETAIRGAEESARRQAFDNFLTELKVEQRHYTRENRLLTHSRHSLVLQERMYFRNIPLSDWIEHEISLDDGADVSRIVQDMTVFDRSVVNITEMPRRKALA